MTEPARSVTVEAARAAAFAIVLLMPSFLVLGYGLAGTSGNSIATGAALAALLAILAALAWRRTSRLDHVDLAFGVFAAIAAVSSVTAIAASRNETIALALTLTSYLAARGLSLEDLPSIRHGTLIAAGTITVIGTPLTAHALFAQWSDPHGHPVVLGLPSAVTMLTMTIGFLVIAVATDGPGGRRLVAWCAALFLPIAIAAASMVRFALIATLGAVLVAAAIAGGRRRRLAAAALALTVLVAVACGLAARHQTTATFLRQLPAAAGAAAQIAIPTAMAASGRRAQQCADGLRRRGRQFDRDPKGVARPDARNDPASRAVRPWAR